MSQSASYCKLLLGLVAAGENFDLADTYYKQLRSLITNQLKPLSGKTSPRITAARASSHYDFSALSPPRQELSRANSRPRSRPPSLLTNVIPVPELELNRSSSSNTVSANESFSPTNIISCRDTPSPRENAIKDIYFLPKLTLLALHFYLAQKANCSMSSQDEQLAIAKTIAAFLTHFPRIIISPLDLSTKRSDLSSKPNEYLALFHDELLKLLKDLWIFCSTPWKCAYSSLTIETILLTYDLLVTLYGEEVNANVQTQFRKNFDYFSKKKRSAIDDDDDEDTYCPAQHFLVSSNNRSIALAHFLLLPDSIYERKIAAIEEERKELRSSLQKDEEMLAAYKTEYDSSVNSAAHTHTANPNTESSQSVKPSSKKVTTSKKDILIARASLDEACSEKIRQIELLKEVLDRGVKIQQIKNRLIILDKTQELLDQEKMRQEKDDTIFRTTQRLKLKEKSQGLEDESQDAVSIQTTEDTYLIKNNSFRDAVWQYLGASLETTDLVLAYSELPLDEFLKKAFVSFSTAFLDERFPFLAALMVLFYSIYNKESWTFSEAITALRPYQNDLESLSCYEINLWLFLLRVGMTTLRRSTDDSDAKKMEASLVKEVAPFNGAEVQDATDLLKEINGTNTNNVETKTNTDIDTIFSRIKSNYDSAWDTFQKEDDDNIFYETYSYVAGLSDNNRRLFILLLAFKLLYQPNDNAIQIIAQFNSLLTFENKKTPYLLVYHSLGKLPSLFLPTIAISQGITKSLSQEDMQHSHSERGTRGTKTQKPKLSERKTRSQTFEDPYEVSLEHQQEQNGQSFDNSR